MSCGGRRGSHMFFGFTVSYDKPLTERERVQIDHLAGRRACDAYADVAAEWLPPGAAVVVHPDGRREVITPKVDDRA